MNIFPKSITLKKITPGTVCRFKYKKHGFNLDPSELGIHNYLLLPVVEDSLLIFVMFTSKVEKIKERYIKTFNMKAYNSLLAFSPTDFSFLTKSISIVDCNDPICGTINEIASNIPGEIDVVSTETDTKIMDKIIEAIMNSPVVSPAIKKKIRVRETVKGSEESRVPRKRPALGA